MSGLRSRGTALAVGGFVLLSCSLLLESSASAAKPLTVWGFGGPPKLAKTDKDFWERASKELGFKIEFVTMTDFQGYLDKLSMSTAAGIGPDIVTRLDFQFARQGLYTDLAPYVKRDRYDMGQFVPSIAKDVHVDGKLFGIPDGANPATLVYNKDLFAQTGLAEPPHDWEDKSWDVVKFMAYGRKLAQLSPDGRQLDRTGVSGMQTEMYWPRMWGGDWTDDAGNVTADSPAVIKAYEFMTDMMKTGIMPGLGRGGPAFESGKAGMMVEGCWGLPNLSAAVKARFKWDLAPVPMGTSRATIGWWDAHVIMKGSKQKENAWRLVKWMHQPRNAAYYFMSFRGYAPFGPALVDDYLAQAGRNLPQVDLKMVTEASRYGAYPKLLMLRQGSNIQNLVSAETGRLFTRGDNVTKWAKSLQVKIVALLASRKK